MRKRSEGHAERHHDSETERKPHANRGDETTGSPRTPAHHREEDHKPQRRLLDDR